LFKDHLNRDIK